MTWEKQLILSGYKALALRHHPDKGGNDDDFKSLVAARDRLLELIKAVEEKLNVLQKNARYIGNTTNHFIPKNLRPEWTVFIRMLQEKIKKKLYYKLEQQKLKDQINRIKDKF